MYIRRCGRGSEESSASMIMCTFLFGGKDSGVLLNACVEHIRQYGGRMGVFHMDYEVQYSLTTKYVDEMLSSNRDILDVYRCCVPFKVGSAASMYQRFWRPWDPCVRWVREMPVEYLGTEAFDFILRRCGITSSRNVFLLAPQATWSAKSGMSGWNTYPGKL